jgi:uncharacterized membrane protein
MRMSSLQLKAPSKELERSIQVKQCLEASPFLKKAVLAIVLFGTAMVLSDGVITPAMSGSIICLFYFIYLFIFEVVGEEPTIISLIKIKREYIYKRIRHKIQWSNTISTQA